MSMPLLSTPHAARRLSVRGVARRVAIALLAALVPAHAMATTEAAGITSFHWFGDLDGDTGGGVMAGWPKAQDPTAPPVYSKGGNGEYLFTPVTALNGPALARIPTTAGHYTLSTLEKGISGQERMVGVIAVGNLVKRPNGDLVGALSPRYLPAERASDPTATSYSAVGDGILYRADHDGANPAPIAATAGQLVDPIGVLVSDAAGNVYGVDMGPAGNGRLFLLDASDTFSVLHEFAAGPDGRTHIPAGLTLGSDGLLYGVTAYRRGIPGDDNIPAAANTQTGTLYRIDPAAPGSFAVLHAFTLAHGEIMSNTLTTRHPYLSGYMPGVTHVVEGPDGWLYGSTSIGNCATARSPETLNATSGPPQNPLCGRSATANRFYKLQYPHYDVSWNVHGTLYRIRKDGSDMQILHRFSDTDGSTPVGPLAVAADGAIYGTTASGGPQRSYYRNMPASGSPWWQCTDAAIANGTCSSPPIGNGVLYRILPARIASNADGTVANGGFELVHAFVKATTGKTPGGLALSDNGMLYGHTTAGGGGYTDSRDAVYTDDYYGTVFSYGAALTSSVTLTFSAAEVAAGTTVDMVWTSSGVSDCVAASSAGDWTGRQDVAGTLTLTKEAGRYTYSLTCIDNDTGRQVTSGAQTLRVGTDASINDGNAMDYGNGGALGTGLAGLLALFALRRRQPWQGG